MKLILFGLVAAIVVSTAWGEQGAETRCSALARVVLEKAQVTHAGLDTTAELAEMKIPRLRTVPSFCRVQVTDRPSGDSEIKTEIWLPVSRWNGRLRAQGNGGFAGVIYLSAMAESVRQGYAAVGTDTGHEGSKPDFALGHPEKVKDFGWRGVHDMTVEAKAVIKAFYGKAQEKAYFTSCSDGGREALMEARRFPEDYDGILAGAPAYNWTALMAAASEGAQRMVEDQANSLPAKKIHTIAAAVNAACDRLDGVKDGVLNDPRTCRFDPETLACKAGDSAKCLLPSQVETLRDIYRGTVNDAGEVTFPGLMPGGEDGPGGWAPSLSGTKSGWGESFFGQGFFANFVYDRSDWTVKEFDFDRDYKLANEKTAEAVNATDTNLAPFVARGGRLILYHGWNDPAIPAMMTVNYYNGVVEKLGQSVVDSSVRLYLVPGMQHCAGGPGATEFGQGMGTRGDASNDIFTALELWVEKGKAPRTIFAKKTVGKRKRVVMTRPLCPYPQVAKYDGKADAMKPKSFACVAGPR